MQISLGCSAQRARATLAVVPSRLMQRRAAVYVAQPKVARAPCIGEAQVREIKEWV